MQAAAKEMQRALLRIIQKLWEEDGYRIFHK